MHLPYVGGSERWSQNLHQGVKGPRPHTPHDPSLPSPWGFAFGDLDQPVGIFEHLLASDGQESWQTAHRLYDSVHSPHELVPITWLCLELNDRLCRHGNHPPPGSDKASVLAGVGSTPLCRPGKSRLDRVPGVTRLRWNPPEPSPPPGMPQTLRATPIAPTGPSDWHPRRLRTDVRTRTRHTNA